MTATLIVTHLFAAGIGIQLGVWLSKRKSVHRRRELTFALNPSVDLSPEEAVRLGEGA